VTFVLNTEATYRHTKVEFYWVHRYTISSVHPPPNQ